MQGDEQTGLKTKPVTIGGWLTKAQGVEFEAYAASLGLDHSALAMILVVRELNCARLPDLVASEFGLPGGKGKRISARTKRTELKLQFCSHAKRHGLSPDAAAARIFRAELSERWLGKILGFDGESS